MRHLQLCSHRNTVIITFLGAGLWAVGCTKAEESEEKPPPTAPQASRAPAGGEAQAHAPGLLPPAPGGENAMSAGRNMPIPAGQKPGWMASNQPHLPKGWKGVGALRMSGEKMPKGAPAWAHTEAQVVQRDGRRFLVASASVTGVVNGALAKTTAEQRARRVISRWIGQQRLKGSMVTGHWSQPGVTYARVEMAIADNILAPAAPN